MYQLTFSVLLALLTPPSQYHNNAWPVLHGQQPGAGDGLIAIVHKWPPPSACPVDLPRVVADRWFADSSLSPSSPFAVVITSCTLAILLLMKRGLNLDTKNSLGTLLLAADLDVSAWFLERL